MDRPPNTASRRALAAVIGVAALIAAACGGTTVDEVAANGAESTESTAAAESSSSTSTADAAPDATESEDAAEVAPVENLFPDVDVVNIQDGSTLNLAEELGGGDQAVLLWFFAPH
ncbi:MAG: hypothetical protein AAF467_20865 [Actinomycetota bacterium]